MRREDMESEDREDREDDEGESQRGELEVEEASGSGEDVDDGCGLSLDNCDSWLRPDRRGLGAIEEIGVPRLL